MPAVDVRNLVKSFGDTKAVRGVTFSVEEGEFFGLLGPNGAGKTTTIRMMTGVLRPDSGSITILGMDMRRSPLEAKQKMGVIPEVGNVYPDLSGRENLELMGRFYGLKRQERESRAEALLKDLGLAGRGDDPVKKYSKGMRQRISIGCAMIHEPPLMFLDEPTEGLDVQSRRMILDKVKAMNKKGSTIVLTTHNIEEASRLCQRVCIINKGQVVVIDSPERLRSTFEGVQSVEVCFDQKVDCSLFATDKCVTRAEEAGDKLRIYTSDPDEAVRRIMQLRDEKGLKIVSMTTLGPTLEDVFVKLTEGKA
ncbi:MAG TPA: ATP-binding cassette domain-containing protein [Methanomassiliicoccales archaeon]|nr:ATP-binding cassette domain-containing protein [Methanomassiliicoccales archaeon]